MLIAALLLCFSPALAQLPDPVGMAKQAGITGIEDAYAGEQPQRQQQTAKPQQRDNPNVLKFPKTGGAARAPVVGGGSFLNRKPIVVPRNLDALNSDNIRSAPSARKKSAGPAPAIEPGRCYYLRGCMGGMGEMKISKACLEGLQYVDCAYCDTPDVKRPYGCDDRQL